MNIKTYAKEALYLCLIMLPTALYCAAPGGVPLKKLSLAPQLATSPELPSFDQINSELEDEVLGLNEFMQKNAHRSAIENEKAIHEEIIKANEALVELQKNHPLSHLSDEELKRLHEFERNGGLTSKDEQEKLNILSKYRRNEQALSVKKLEAQLKLSNLNPQECDALLEYNQRKHKILTLESQSWQQAYKKLTSQKLCEKVKAKLYDIPDQPGFTEFKKHHGVLLTDFQHYSAFPKESIHYKKRYGLCSIALERDSIKEKQLLFEREFWKEKYEEQKNRMQKQKKMRRPKSA